MTALTEVIIRMAAANPFVTGVSVFVLIVGMRALTIIGVPFIVALALIVAALFLANSGVRRV